MAKGMNHLAIDPRVQTREEFISCSDYGPERRAKHKIDEIDVSGDGPLFQTSCGSNAPLSTKIQCPKIQSNWSLATKD
ncbi:hypothetical protein BTUL_0201g00080 [Botrytis tulipae]|uniref:Uncharacterized protein n=1 Tax=Botrytis tulipae TaxID=87230 RepID=A0A4Z1E8S9_9HELO|nr:hypothetical protein BTUL_0201g00080 [Botrytis tulipae]